MKIGASQMSDLIYKYYKEYPIFQFTDIIIENDLLLISEKQYGIFSFDISNPETITFKRIETISDIKRMYLYQQPQSIKETNKTLVLWLEIQSNRIQIIKEYSLIMDTFKILFLKEIKLMYFKAINAVLAGNYLILSQDNLVKLYRPGIPEGIDTFEFNNLDFDTIVMVIKLSDRRMDNSFIIVHPDRITIYKLELSFLVLCNNLENIHGNFMLNYEFKTLNCLKNMTYIEANYRFYCEFKIQKLLEGGRSEQNSNSYNKDALIIGLTVGLFGLMIILIAVCCYLRKLKRKYEILESSEIKKTRKQYQESEKEIIDNKIENNF